MTDATTTRTADRAREDAVEAALGGLDLDAKAALLSGQDMWTLPAAPEIGLRSLVTSDGPVGVRGAGVDPDDPSIALPSPTALAAAWDPELARRAGQLLAQEARRKGVHVLLAPTVNLHRTPVGGRHFECYSEDPLLTGEIGAAYVRGVQDGGVGTTVKHFVANDSETERFTLDARISERALRELYLAPFETVVKKARPWGVMAAYNSVNGCTMTEHAHLQNRVLRGEWGFDGFVVSDWMAARDTVRAVTGGLDVAMPGPRTVYGPALADAVREGRVEEKTVDDAVRRVLRLAARVGILDGAPAVVDPSDLPAPADGAALAREIARRSFVLLKNDAGILPVETGTVRRVAVIGRAATEGHVLGGGSAEVHPQRVVTALEGLRAALPEGVGLVHAPGPELRTKLAPARDGYRLRLVYRDARGEVLAELPQPDGRVAWAEPPEEVAPTAWHSVEIAGVFTPDRSGVHAFAVSGYGEFLLAVGGRTLYDDRRLPAGDDPFAFMDATELRFAVELAAGAPVEVTLAYVPPPRGADGNTYPLNFGLGHRAPCPSDDELIEQAVAAAAGADVAVVVVATTEEVESESFDRTSLRLPGRQDELVSRVAAANPRTVVVVNAGAPVEMPWRDQAAAVLLTWFPGQEGGAALAEVLLGRHEPGGRLPTTWPVRIEDCPVLESTPSGGVLRYDEDVFIGYRAWERAGVRPAYWFGHGLGYTDWSYEQAGLRPAEDSAEQLGVLVVRVRNTGRRAGGEVVQVYLEPQDPAVATGAERPARWLAGFASVQARAGETAEVRIAVPRRAVQVWDDAGDTWRTVEGSYLLRAGSSYADLRLTARLEVAGE
ncbi:beta-glucosidase family protein [Streptomyces sp.]|uniref:beta-glucosidase family protein n=1 Tax=Streptomyces sp. TaxID=1931 RepID=UPI002F41B7C0